MSIRLQAFIWEAGPEDRSQRLLMLAIADNANDQGICWPAMTTLAKKTCMNVRTVLRALKALEQQGWLMITRKSHEHKGNTYEINLEKLGVTMSPDTVPHDKLSRDKTYQSQVTNRTKSGDKSCNPPHPLIGRTIKNHKEPSGDLVLEAVEIWNRNCGDSLPRVRGLSTDRRKKLNTRISDAQSPQGYLLDFERAVKLCATTPFLQGKSQRGDWRATFDWLIANDQNVGKVLEGNYGKPTIAGNPTAELSAAEQQAAEYRRRQMSVIPQEAAVG